MTTSQTPAWRLVPVEPTSEMRSAWSGHAAENDWRAMLAAAPAPASVQPLREPKPDDLLTVANIVQDGVTLTLEINQLGDLVHLIGEDEAAYGLHVTTMTRADFDDLGDFDGF